MWPRDSNMSCLSQYVGKKPWTWDSQARLMWPSGSSSSPGLAAEGEGGWGRASGVRFFTSWLLSKLQWKLTKMSPQNEVWPWVHYRPSLMEWVGMWTLVLGCLAQKCSWLIDAKMFVHHYRNFQALELQTFSSSLDCSGGKETPEDWKSWCNKENSLQNRS